jgi:hypothetical protein
MHIDIPLLHFCEAKHPESAQHTATPLQPQHGRQALKHLTHHFFILLHINILCDIRNMAFPSPIQVLDAFLAHLDKLALHSISTAFVHYQKWPIQIPGAWYNEDSSQQWCDQMDALLVSWIQFWY